MPINQNQALFALLGTTFGGDGRVNFGLPDLRGRVPIHVGSGNGLGQRGGEQTHTLTVAEIPAHVHTASAINGNAATGDPTGAFLAVPPTGIGSIYATQPTTTLNANSVGATGGSQPHQNMQPFLTLSFCIALQGIFPSQS